MHATEKRNLEAKKRQRKTPKGGSQAWVDMAQVMPDL